MVLMKVDYTPIPEIPSHVSPLKAAVNGESMILNPEALSRGFCVEVAGSPLTHDLKHEGTMIFLCNLASL